MKKVARVIVKYDCPRNCENCCNQHIGTIPEVKFNDLLKYEEIVITGSEPLIAEIAPKVVEFIHHLEAVGYLGKLWIYTAELNTKRWADKAILKAVDGITYTLHYEYSQRDITLLKRLSSELQLINNHKQNNRLVIDSRLKEAFNWSDFNLSRWNSVTWLEWKDDECTLPDNEELVFYDLEKDNE